MKNCFCIIFMLNVFTSFTLVGQTELPKTAICMPRFLLGLDNIRAVSEAKIKNRTWEGFETNDYWNVFSDRSDNNTYTSSSGTEIYKKLAFKEKVRIAKISNNGRALVYREIYAQSKLEISKEAISLGWIELDHLLLWNSCPVNEFKIYDKGVVVNNLDEYVAGGQNNFSPKFYKSPQLMDSTGNEARRLEFYFIFKEQSGALLIGKESQITGSRSEDAVILGWISSRKIARWNQRICLEPVFGPTNINLLRNIGVRPAVFFKRDQAIEYKRSRSMTDAFFIPFLDSIRMQTNIFRYPVIPPVLTQQQLQEDFIHNVVTIGNMSTSNRSIAEDRKNFTDLKKKQANVNVMFVVDGTTSMGKFYQPIIDALVKSAKREDLTKRFQFGAAIYRDYVDKERAVEITKLNSDINPVIKFLKNAQVKSSPLDRDLPEALYNGISYTLENAGFDKDESNFIILVGDCGNHLKDIKGPTLEKVVDKLVEKSINLIAFQANAGTDPSYDFFVSQIKRMIKTTIKRVAGSDIEFKNTRNGYYESVPVGDKNEPKIIVGGIAFNNNGSSLNTNTLQILIEKKIVDFDTQVKDWLTLLETWINKPTTGVEYEAVKRWMKNIKGYTDAEIRNIQGEEFKVNGYTSSKIITAKHDTIGVFNYVVFISQAEYMNLIENLKGVMVADEKAPNRRELVQNALKKLALSNISVPLGEDIKKWQIDDIMKLISGTTSVSNSLKGRTIEDIIYKEKISDQDFARYLYKFKNTLDGLEAILNNPDYYFESNALFYYWIPLNEMP